MMKISHIEHIGIAVKSIGKAREYYERILGLKCYGIERIEDQKVLTALFRVGDTKIELLESTSPDGPVAKFIEKRGEGIHHIAFAVDDVGEALKNASSNGIKLIDAEPRKGAEGMDIGFLHPFSTFGALTEFCAKPDEEGGSE